MFNYMRGELYRVFHKKSLYIVFGVCALLYLGMVGIRAGQAHPLSVDMILSDASEVFMLIPPILGGFLFSAFYVDDLSAKNLITLVGYGRGKVTIVIAKFILFTLVSSIIFALVPLYMMGLFALFGTAGVFGAAAALYGFVLKALLTVVVFGAITTILVYGLQRATVAVVMYVLMTLNIIDQLLDMIFSVGFIKNLAPHLSDYLVSVLVANIKIGVADGKPPVAAFVECGIYVVVALVLSILAFRKKELEF